MDEALPGLLAYKSYAVALWFALLFAAERARSAARPGGPWRWDWTRLSRNGGLWLLTVGASLLIVLPVTAWAAAHVANWRPDWWRGSLGLLLDLLLLDFLIYWWHRANHEVPFLWRFHEVHHLDRFLDTTTALRFHFGEVLLSAVFRAAVILVLAIPLASVLAFEALLLIATIFHHSNLRLPPKLERALARVVITPSIHWVHHHALKRDTDSNYGTVFSFWDPIFRSRNRWTVRTPEMEIGVEAAPELPLAALVMRPFAARR